MAHTPGPWRVENSVLNIIAQPTPYLPDGLIAATRYLGNAPERETEHAANAALLAAAPDLLAACRKVVNNWGDLHPKDLQQLRAAIAKAEGRP